MNLLLDFLITIKEVRLEKITFSTIDYQTIVDFICWLENTRGCSAKTVNHRLSCIRSFFKYVCVLHPVLAVHWHDLGRVPAKKTGKSLTMEFMTETALKAVLEQPDATEKRGVRDLFFMVLMYDSAARNSELLNLRIGDFSHDSNTPCVYLCGKGNKRRAVPVMQKTVDHFQRYRHVFHMDSGPEQYMFYTVRRGAKQQMSDDNVARFLKAYGTKAKQQCVEVPDSIYPHMFRRTRAIHLYRSGMPLALLSEWLGHEDPETSLIYAYADTEMKRRAIEKATGGDNPLVSDKATALWEGNDEMIRKLYGLR
jgi:site-specific recombinase XerD